MIVDIMKLEFIAFFVLFLIVGKTVSRKWKDVKDSYRKYRKKLSTKSGQEAKSVKEYKYAKQLEFLIPHMAMHE